MTSKQLSPGRSYRRLVLALVAGTLYLLALVFAVTVLSQHGGTAKDAGWQWRTSDAGVFVDSVTPEGPVARWLQEGDRVVSANQDDRAAKAGPRPWLQTVQPGESYHMEWESSSGLRETDFRMGRKRVPGHLAMGICDLFLSVSFGAVGLFMWIARAKDPLARHGGEASVLMAVFLAGSSIGPVSPLLNGAPLIIYFLLKSTFPFNLVAGYSFFSQFPTGEQPQGVWRLIGRGLWFAAVVVWLVTIPQRVVPHLGLEWRLAYLSAQDLVTRPELNLVPLRYGITGVCALAACAVLISNYRRLTTAAMRLRVRWLTLGSATALLPPSLNSLGLAFGHATGLVAEPSLSRMINYHSLSTVSLALIPITAAYAIVCHRLMGIRVFFSRSISFLAARHILQILTLVPAIILVYQMWRYRSFTLAALLRANYFLVFALALALVATIFRYEILQLLGRIYLRLTYDQDQVLKGLLGAMMKERSVSALAGHASARIVEAFHPENLYLYYARQGAQQFEQMYGFLHGNPPKELNASCDLVELVSGAGTVLLTSDRLARLSTKEQGWVRNNDLILAVPLVAEATKRLSGVLLLGPKQSGESYTGADVDLLEEVSARMSLAIEHLELEIAHNEAVRKRLQAEESNRLKGQFLAQMSHELRNPLNGMIGLTELLQDTELTEEQLEYAEMILRSSESLLAIVNDVLDISKIEAGKLQLETGEVEWIPLLEDIVATMAELARGKGVELHLLADPAVPRSMAGDPGRLRQVFVNLVDNAVKFTHQGRVVIRATMTDQTVIRFGVEDTGIGIAEEFLPQLFQPFEQSGRTTARDYGGTGLGLAISKRIVEAMGGQIGAESCLGKGSTFWFTLPYSPPTEPAVCPARRSLEGVRVLSVDSDELRLEATSQVLTEFGAEADSRMCASWDLIHTTIAATAPDIDIILLDVTVRGEEKHTTIRELLRVMSSAGSRPAPIILISGSSLELTRDDKEALGVAEEVVRPFRRSFLLRTLQRVLEQESAACGASPASDSSMEKPRAGRRVLVVEDSVSNQRAMHLMLERLGWQTEVASDGAQALARLQAKSFDLILMDCQMQGMDGLEAASRIRQLGGTPSRTPIVAVTGNTSVDDKERCIAAGMDDFLQKPISLSDLRTVVLRWANRSSRSDSATAG